MFSGKCWQVQYSRRSRGPQVGGSPPGPSPSRGRTSSRGGHAGNRHSLRREESQADRVSRWTLGPKPIGLCPGTGLGLLSNLRLGSSRKTLRNLDSLGKSFPLAEDCSEFPPWSGFTPLTALWGPSRACSPAQSQPDGKWQPTEPRTCPRAGHHRTVPWVDPQVNQHRNEEGGRLWESNQGCYRYPPAL